MFSDYFTLKLLLLCTVLIPTALSLGMIRPIVPLKALFANINSPSYYIFNFKIETALPSSNYIAITFANFTTLTSPYCLMGINSTTTSTAATCTSSGNILYIATSTALTSYDSIYLFTTFTETQSSSGFSAQFAIQTQTTNTNEYFLYDVNPTFGLIYWSATTPGSLYVSLQSYGTAATQTSPGTTNTAVVLLRVGADTPGNSSVLVVTVSSPFTFASTFTVSVANSPQFAIAQAAFLPTSSYLAPEGVYAQYINPNQVQINFAEKLTSGREFLLTMNSVVNPISVATGKMSFFFMSQNSSQVLEENTNSVTMSVVTNTLTLTVGLSSGIPWSSTASGPVQLYKGDRAFLRASVVTPVAIPAGSTIVFSINSDNSFVGLSTVYFSPVLQNQVANTPLSYTYTSTSITITNLAAIASGETIYIQFAVQTSTSEPTLTSTMTISVGSSVFYTATNTRQLYTAASSMLTSIMGQSGEANIININAGQVMDLTVNILDDDGLTGSYMLIYFPSAVTQSGSMTVQIQSGGPLTAVTTTTFTTGTGYNLLKIDSDTGNLFTTTLTRILISNFNLGSPSNNQDSFYELYISLVRDTSVSDYRNLHVNLAVTPTRGSLTNLYESYGNLYQSNNLITTQAYPNFIRILGDAGAIPLIPTASQTVILTVYKQESWSNVISFTDGGSYPCASNLAVTCKAYSGSAKSNTDFLFWAQIQVALPSNIATNAFDIYIPFFHPSTTTWLFEFTVGLLDTTTSVQTLSYLETTLSFTPSQTSFGTQVSTLALDFDGQYAGAKVTGLAFDVSTNTGHLGNTASAFGAATVLTVNWDFWDSTSAISNPASPFDSTAINSPVATMYTTTFGSTWTSVFFPMVNSAAVTTAVRFLLDNVIMPLTFDAPDYYVLQTTRTGSAYGYNSFINTNRAVLVPNIIDNTGITCTKMVQGYANSYCTVQFNPRSRIDKNGVIEIEFDTGFPSTSSCTIQYGSPATVIPTSQFTCVSRVNLLTITFSGTSDFPSSQLYQVSFYGLDHSTTADNTLHIEIYSEAMGYMIQSASKAYNLPSTVIDYIIINSINYDYLNVDSTSALSIGFTINRDRYPNEVLQLNLGSNIQSNNKVTTKLSIILTNTATNTEIPALSAIQTDKVVLTFASTSALSQGSYQLRLINLRTPSTHASGELQLLLKRTYDNAYTMTQDPAETPVYPTLQLQVASSIKLTSARYMCVGCLSELIFTVTSANSYIDSSSVFYFSFPSYYSPGLANAAEDLQCLINSENIFCESSPTYPYLLILRSSPLFLNPGDSFTITVYGVRVPEPPSSSNETIFFAIDSWHNRTYSEQGLVAPPEIVPQPNSQTGNIVLYGVSATSFIIRTNTQYTLQANISVGLPAGSFLNVDFPSAFSNFKYVGSMSCSISVVTTGGLTYTGYSTDTCTVTAKTTQFTISKAIDAGSTMVITLGNVPNPLTSANVNFGTIELFAFDSTKNNLLAVSNPGYNQATEFSYGDLSKYVQANYGQDITVTVGTYSNPVVVTTNDNTRFIQDVNINADTPGFMFVPSVLNFYIGDSSSTFKIGCDKSVKVSTYPLLLSQTEDSILKNTYGSLFNLKVYVTAEQIPIVVPTSIDVQWNGYSLPHLIQLTNAPYVNLVLRVNIDYSIYGETFKIDSDFSSPTLVFTPNVTSNLIAVYVSPNVTNTTLIANLMLDGDNYQSYKLSQDYISFNIINLTLPEPTIDVETTDIDKTTVTLTLTPNQQGVFIYQLTGTCGTALDSNTLRNRLRNNSFEALTVEENFCTSVYAIKILDSATATTYTLTGLTPDTDYVLYGYFINNVKNITTNVTTISFHTLRNKFHDFQIRLTFF